MTNKNIIDIEIINDIKDSKKEIKDLKELKELKDLIEQKELKDQKDLKGLKEIKDIKDIKELKVESGINTNKHTQHTSYYNNILQLFNTEENKKGKNNTGYKPHLSLFPTSLNTSQYSGFSGIKKNYFNKAQKLKKSFIDKSEIIYNANSKFECGVKLDDYNKYKKNSKLMDFKAISRNYKSTNNSFHKSNNVSDDNMNTELDINNTGRHPSRPSHQSSLERNDKRILINLKKSSQHEKNKSVDNNAMSRGDICNTYSNVDSRIDTNKNNKFNIFNEFKKYKNQLRMKDLQNTLSHKNSTVLDNEICKFNL